MLRILICTSLILLPVAPAVAQTRRAAPAPAPAAQGACSASISLNFTKIEWSHSASGLVHGAGPGAGPHVLATVTVPSSGGPSVQMHAINTKGAGQERQAGVQPSAPVTCDSSVHRDTGSVSTCDISGSADSQTILVGLLLPAVQRRGGGAQTWEISLVPHQDGAVADEGGVLVACSSSVAGHGGWDLKGNVKV